VRRTQGSRSVTVTSGFASPTKSVNRTVKRRPGRVGICFAHGEVGADRSEEDLHERGILKDLQGKMTIPLWLVKFEAAARVHGHLAKMHRVAVVEVHGNKIEPAPRHEQYLGFLPETPSHDRWLELGRGERAG